MAYCDFLITRAANKGHKDNCSTTVQASATLWKTKTSLHYSTLITELKSKNRTEVAKSQLQWTQVPQLGKRSRYDIVSVITAIKMGLKHLRAEQSSIDCALIQKPKKC